MRPSTDIRVLLLERDLLSEKNGAIFGKLYINGVYFCDTLENKRFLASNGNYYIQYCDSPKFGRKLPLWYDQGNYPPERGLRIHAGNTKDDSQGCILVGKRLWVNNVLSNKLKSSKDTLQKLCDIFETDTRDVNNTVLLIRTV
jgi:hypothetical protein